MKFATFGRRNRAAAQELPGSVDAALRSAFEGGRWRVPESFNFTRDVVEALAGDGKREALVFLGKDGVIEPRTFRQLAENAARWATKLREQGVRPGDRILVTIGRNPDWIEVMLAAIKVGAVTVPSPESLSAAALDIRISSSGAKLVVASRAAEVELVQTSASPALLFADDVSRIARDLPTQAATHDTATRDLAFVLSTSGTASGPKGVSHTHAASFAARVQAAHWLDAGSGDVVWCTADTGSALAVWNVLLGPWSRGARIVLHEGPFDPEERLDLISRMEVNVLCQTPAEYRALLETGERMLRRYRPHRLRRVVSTGDHVSPDLIAAFEEAWDLTIHEGYGQAETGIIAGHGIGAGFRSGSVGLPLPGFEVAVIDESGNELAPGREGDLAVRGRPPSLFTGYWDSPDETKAAFRGDWYLTGDVAATDEDGFIWFMGRARDVITSGGRRFGPVEVEETLATHEAIAEAGVVGIRDLARGGHFVRAFVVLRPEVEGSDRLVAEIRERVRESLPDYKVPREIEFVEELPVTPSGKLRRLELRERLVVGPEPVWDTAPPPPLTPDPEPVEEPVEEHVEAGRRDTSPEAAAPQPEPVTPEPPARKTSLEPASQARSAELIAELVAPPSELRAEAVPEAPPAVEPEPVAPQEPLPEYIAHEASDYAHIPVEEPEPQTRDDPPADESLPDYISHEASDYASIPVPEPEREALEDVAPAGPLPDYVAHEASDYASIPLPEPERETLEDVAPTGPLPDFVVAPSEGETEPEPEADTETEPETESEAEAEGEAEPENALEAGSGLAAEDEAEGEVAPEPGAVAGPEPSAGALPAPVADVVEPVPQPDPEPEPVPQPDPEPEPEPELVVEPVAGAEPAPRLRAEGDVEEPGARPPQVWTVVSTPSESGGEQGERSSVAEVEAPEADEDSRKSRRRAKKEAKAAGREASGRRAKREPKPEDDRKAKSPKPVKEAPVAAKRSRARKSAPEPGEENQETSWMRGLSSRLRAYSLADENGEPGDAVEEPEPTDTEKTS